MLKDSARTWLNSLPKNSIKTWLDFEEVFARNFTSTYRRPGRARQLQQCVQGDKESDRDYLTCWTLLRKSCEGICEDQAIQFFSDGCRDGTMLKHKLMWEEPGTMAELMAIADKYATADSAMKKTIWLNAIGLTIANPEPAPRPPAGSSNGGGLPRRNSTGGRNNNGYHGKRKGLM